MSKLVTTAFIPHHADSAMEDMLCGFSRFLLMMIIDDVVKSGLKFISNGPVSNDGKFSGPAKCEWQGLLILNTTWPDGRRRYNIILIALWDSISDQGFGYFATFSGIPGHMKGPCLFWEKDWAVSTRQLIVNIRRLLSSIAGFVFVN